jgi:hypothetical protein
MLRRPSPDRHGFERPSQRTLHVQGGGRRMRNEPLDEGQVFTDRLAKIAPLSTVGISMNVAIVLGLYLARHAASVAENPALRW